VSGNGQRELAQCLAGLRKTTAGAIVIDGQDVTHASLRKRMEAGQAYIPEERMRDGAIREFSVQENLFLHEHASPRYTHSIFLDFAKMAAHARDLAQPTRGVDIGATEYIHQRLLEQRATGTAILLISEDLDEIRTLSDRIAVMYEGHIIGVVERDQVTVEQIGLMMAGIPMNEAVQRSESPVL